VVACAHSNRLALVAVVMEHRLDVGLALHFFRIWIFTRKITFKIKKLCRT
jgi:hypothetical protein